MTLSAEAACFVSENREMQAAGKKASKPATRTVHVRTCSGDSAVADLGSDQAVEVKPVQLASIRVSKFPTVAGTKHQAKVAQPPSAKKVAIKVIKNLLRPQQKAAFVQGNPRSSSPFNLRTGVKKVLKFYNTKYVKDGAYETVADAASYFINKHALEDATFYVYNLGELYRLYCTWRTVLPRVTPFYAVKCNPEPAILSMLYAMGAGFDCASVQELDRVLDMGVPHSRIIFANPCKKIGDFAYANRKGVEATTFDCVSELRKIAEHRPEFNCILRIRCDDSSAHINLGLKYGAELEDIPTLLQAAKDMKLKVGGVSFHVGSGCKNPDVYRAAIESARYAFDLGSALGFNMMLLDIGGGYTSPRDERTWGMFHAFASVINSALDKHFPSKTGVRIISEPGQYFAETTATLFTSVIGHKVSMSDSGEQMGAEYWLSDGCFGSFRIPVVVDGLQLPCQVVRSPLLPAVQGGEERVLPSTLWGPSPDPADCVLKGTVLPMLRNGDFVAWHHAGAYTVAAAGNFAGLRAACPHKFYVFAKDAVPGKGTLEVME